MLIYLVVFDSKSTQLGYNLYPDLEAYIDHNYVCDKREEEYGDKYFGSVRPEEAAYSAYRENYRSLEEKLHRPRERALEVKMMAPICDSVDEFDIDEADDSLAEIDECEFYEENKSQDEISDITGIPQTTVSYRLKKVIKKLRKIMGIKNI